jgi:hypothetical protein
MMTAFHAMQLKAGDLLAGETRYGLCFGRVACMTSGYVEVRWEHSRTGEAASYVTPYRFFEMGDIRHATAADREVRDSRRRAGNLIR